MRPELLSAKMHQVEVVWRLRTTREVVIDPTPRLVLAVRALRDVELLTLRVDYPDLGYVPGEAEALLAVVPHAAGQRVLKPEGEPWVDGQEDLAAPPEGVGPVSEIRWWGDSVETLVHNVNRHPAIYWVYRGRVEIPKGLCVGLIVRASVPTVCRAKLGGVG